MKLLDYIHFIRETRRKYQLKIDDSGGMAIEFKVVMCTYIKCGFMLEKNLKRHKMSFTGILHIN